ncbi:hypothetical protein [Nonomuraea rhizosphaerae]|uniref:hypothetical protein n=1 Tax=Nonomuraea rhizosphaerae TaxID=2665663 RepID=UPI001C5E5F8F|nr:hypothetical protein [Nonomuraea rhizosphaerae]
MRKSFAAAALVGSMALTGLALAPTAQAATQSQAQSQATVSAGTITIVNWGKFFSSDRKAYTTGRTWKSGGVVHTTWHGFDKVGGKKGWVWFEYYKNGGWHKFNRSWDGKFTGGFNLKGAKKVYTFTCWAGKFDNCGRKFRIY